MAKLTKRQKAIAEKIEAGKQYGSEDAKELLAELSTIKFKESVDISINLGVDPRKSDANGAANRSTSNNTSACTMPAMGVFPPFLILVAVRAIAPVAGMPPKNGVTKLAIPWAINS